MEIVIEIFNLLPEFKEKIKKEHPEIPEDTIISIGEILRHLIFDREIIKSPIAPLELHLTKKVPCGDSCPWAKPCLGYGAGCPADGRHKSVEGSNG